MSAAVALLLAASIGLLLVVVHLLILIVRSRLVPGPPMVGATVVIHTCGPDEKSIRGVLIAQHADRLTLREATYLHGSGEQEAGGLVHVPAGNVSFVQEIV